MLRLLSLLVLLLTACQPIGEGSPNAASNPQAPPRAIAAESGTAVAEPAPIPSATVELRHFRQSLDGIAIEAVRFDARTHRLRVADQPAGPASRWATAREAGLALGGLAAINGGFFTPEGTPLGRLVSDGTPVGSIHML